MPAARRYVSIADLPAQLPVFPLTGALLLPHTRLPLNIFEPRYLAMIDEAMYGERVIGMVQPREPGEDMAAKPELASVGCAGRIVSYSETDDGRYVITLAGLARFRIARELEVDTPFRQVTPDYALYIHDLKPAPDAGLSSERKRLMAALKPYLSGRQLDTDWRSIESSESESLINALSMICPFDPGEKQALLEARTLKERAEALIALIEMANADMPPESATPRKRRAN